MKARIKPKKNLSQFYDVYAAGRLIGHVYSTDPEGDDFNRLAQIMTRQRPRYGHPSCPYSKRGQR